MEKYINKLVSVENNDYDADDELCDQEIQFYMKDHIRVDRCICRKYKKPNSSKKCPHCQKCHPARSYARKPTSPVNVPQTCNRTDSTNEPASPHKSYTTTTCNVRETSRKRKPKLIPATDYIAKYYFPQLMKYENLTLPAKKPRRVVGAGHNAKGTVKMGDAKCAVKIGSAGKGCKPLVEAQKHKGHLFDNGTSLANELSRLCI